MLQKYTSSFLIINFKKDEQQRVIINTNAYNDQQAATKIYNSLKKQYPITFIVHEGTANFRSMCNIANQLKLFVYLKHS